MAQYKGLDLHFDYAIKFPNGKYYTGRVNSEQFPDHWQGEAHEAFTFTEQGAYRKRDSLECFADCIVERII